MNPFGGKMVEKMMNESNDKERLIEIFAGAKKIHPELFFCG